MADTPPLQPLVVAVNLTGMTGDEEGRSQPWWEFGCVYGNTGLSWQAALFTVPPPLEGDAVDEEDPG